MKDLSREEKLEQEILQMAEKCGDKKWMRVKRTIFILSGVVYLMAFMCDGMNDIKDYFGWLIAAPIMALFIMFISSMILLYITSGAMEDEKAIAKKIGELNVVKSEKYNKLEDEKIKELKRHIEYLENYQEKLIEEKTYLRLNKIFDNEVKQNEKD